MSVRVCLFHFAERALETSANKAMQCNDAYEAVIIHHWEKGHLPGRFLHLLCTPTYANHTQQDGADSVAGTTGKKKQAFDMQASKASTCFGWDK